MAPNKAIIIEIGVALVLVTTIFSHEAIAQSGGCTRVLISLSSCLNYVTGSSSTPSSSCCSKLAEVVQSQPQCLCSVINGGGGVSSLGVTVNQTLAVSLPGACNVQTPPISRCNNAANGPASTPETSTGVLSPLTSPTSPPADTSEDSTTPQTNPNKSTDPNFQSGVTGSKTILPTRQVYRNNGSTVKVSLYLNIFALLFRLLYVVTVAF